MRGAVDFMLPLRGFVELKDVSFSYRAGQPILQKLDIQLQAGEKVALVGISGSGKSTTAKLIARLYDAEGGTVKIDGIDVRGVRLESLRTNICYVMQEGILFDRTLKENLLPYDRLQRLKICVAQSRLQTLKNCSVDSPKVGTRHSDREAILYLEANGNESLWLVQYCNALPCSCLMNRPQLLMPLMNKGFSRVWRANYQIKRFSSSSRIGSLRSNGLIELLS